MHVIATRTFSIERYGERAMKINSFLSKLFVHFAPISAVKGEVPNSEPFDASADEIWRELLANTDLFNARPDFMFDPCFYSARYPEVKSEFTNVRDHYENFGKHENRFASNYEVFREIVPTLDQKLAQITIDPRLRALIDAGRAEVYHLIFELVSLGDPIDRMVSDFSEIHYFASYPDIQGAGLIAFHHFINHGLSEGR